MEALNDYINPALWVVANLAVLYICAALIVWVALYGLRFKWYETPAGSLVFWFTLSLLGIVALIFVALFVESPTRWYVAPVDVLVWRPSFRFVVYLGVAVALTRLVSSLIRRLRGRSELLFDVVPRNPRPPHK